LNKIYLIIFFKIFLNADIDVYVSTDNNITVKNITKQELTNIYLKKTNKIRGEKIHIFNNKNNYDEFNKKVLNKRPEQIHAYWMKQIFLGKNIPPKNLNYNEIKLEIENSKNTIGYSSKKIKGKVIYETK